MAAVTKSMIVRNVPPEIRARLADAVEEKQASANDIVVGILAKHFKQPFVPTGRKPESGAYETLILRVPPELRAAIRMRAATIDGGTSTGVILAVLQKHFKLSATSRVRRSRRSRLASVVS